MKLYSYSSEMLTFAEAKWFRPTLVSFGILVGVIMFLGFARLKHSSGNTLWPQSVDTLAGQNDIMRQQLSLLSPRVRRLDAQATQFYERAGSLLLVLRGNRILTDSVSRHADINNRTKPRSVVVAARRFRP